VWHERHALADHLVAELSTKLSKLQQREALVDEAFLYEDEAFLYKREIDRPTYERQRDKLREDIALVRIELEDAKLDEIDLEGC
jgi:hypothetical protein